MPQRWLRCSLHVQATPFYGRLFDSSSLISQISMSKWTDPAFLKFAGQGQHLARISTPDSPLNQASVLVELIDISQPFRAR
jgi:hypothetical protein